MQDVYRVPSALGSQQTIPTPSHQPVPALASLRRGLEQPWTLSLGALPSLVQRLGVARKECPLRTGPAHGPCSGPGLEDAGRPCQAGIVRKMQNFPWRGGRRVWCVRLPVPGTGRSTHPANWERTGSPGGGAGQERKCSHSSGSSAPFPCLHVVQRGCLPRPAGWAQPPAQGQSCLRSAHAQAPGAPALASWALPEALLQQAPAGTQSRGTPAVRSPSGSGPP